MISSFFNSNQSARKLSQFAESAMAVNRVILQQFSMQLNYLNNKERSNIYQPSLKQQQNQPVDVTSVETTTTTLPVRQLSSSDDDCFFDKCSESSSYSSMHPTSPSEQSSDEDIQTILDNVLISNNNPNIPNAIISKCEEINESPLQTRRRQQRPLFIVCPTPSG
jgi:hypothetical protein